MLEQRRIVSEGPGAALVVGWPRGRRCDLHDDVGLAPVIPVLREDGRRLGPSPLAAETHRASTYAISAVLAWLELIDDCLPRLEVPSAPPQGEPEDGPLLVRL